MKHLDELLKATIEQEKVEPPSLYFEEQLMGKIEIEAFKKRNTKKHHNLAMLFFTLGTLFGLFFGFALPYVQQIQIMEEAQIGLWFIQATTILLLIILLIQVKKKYFKTHNL